MLYVFAENLEMFLLLEYDIFLGRLLLTLKWQYVL